MDKAPAIVLSYLLLIALVAIAVLIKREGEMKYDFTIQKQRLREKIAEANHALELKQFECEQLKRKLEAFKHRREAS